MDASNGETSSAVEVSKLTERLDQIRSQPKLQSQQQTALVLKAVEDTLREQGSAFSPTAYFAALLSLLGQHVSASTGVVNKEVASAVVYLLDLVTPEVPAPLLRSKFGPILSSLSPTLNNDDADAPFLRSAIGCLVSLLLAQDGPAWALPQSQIGPRKALAGLLTLSMDSRPKVRRRAHEGIANVLSNGPPSPSLDHPAADMCAETSLRSFEALAADSKQQARHQQQSQQHEPAMIHAMQLIETIAVAAGGWPSRSLDSLTEVLFAVAKSRGEYLTTAAFDVFEAVLRGMADDETSSKLPRLLEAMMEVQPSQNDSQLLPPWLAVISRGHDVSAQMDPNETFQKLPQVFERISGFLASASYNIRVSASECLVSFLVNCVPSEVILEPSVYDEKVLEKLGDIIAKLFDVKYQAAWMEVFNIVGAAFENLRWQSVPVLNKVITTLGDLRASDAFQSKDKADEIIAKAIKFVGAEPILSLLPLNLTPPGSGQKGRAWLVPLLRDNAANTRLAHFKLELVPLSEALYQKVMDQSGQQKTVEVKIFETLVQQIWSCLPGYCDRPLDVVEAFDQSFAEMIAKLLYQQPEMRANLCRALQNLVLSFTGIAQLEGDEDLVAQGRIGRDDAQKILSHVAGFSSNLLAVLFNVYGETSPQFRGPILSCINAYLSIMKSEELDETFARVASMLETSITETSNPLTQEGESTSTKQKSARLPPVSHALMDLVVAMAIYLPRTSFQRLFSIAAVILPQQKEPQLQKKAYKLLPRLSLSSIGNAALIERSSELQSLLLNNADTATAPARKDRLAAISTVVSTLPQDALHFIPSILPEVILLTKEPNERAREAAFTLLITMGTRMRAPGGSINHALIPSAPDNAPTVPASLTEYFTILSTGLAGTSPHMIAATVMALARATFHFHAFLPRKTIQDLLDTLLLFLTSPTREVVRAVLGFVKVAVVSLSTDLIQPRLPELIPALLRWAHEHKANFRTKVKNILERVMRRFGYETVVQLCPDEDKKLVVAIRKTRDRRKKQKKAGGADEGGDGDMVAQRRGKFDSEFDAAVYGSDDSDSSDSGDEDGEDDSGVALQDSKGRKQNQPRAGKQGKTNGKSRDKAADAYIHEEEDEPLDLLSPSALGHISSTRPLPSNSSKSKPKLSKDGKLTFRDKAANGKADHVEADMMAVDAQAGAKDGGVDAYVQAIRGKHAAVRGQRGKLKFGAKRTKDGVADDGDEDGDRSMEDGLGANAGRSESDRGRGKGKGGSDWAGGRGGRGAFGKVRGGSSGRGGDLGGHGRSRGLSRGRVGKPRGRSRR